jgi:tRNA_anti-like
MKLIARSNIASLLGVLALVAATGVASGIDATQLTNEFSQNQAAFGQKYTGRVLEVSGPVYAANLDQVRVGRMSGPNIVLTGPFWRISCFLSDADKQRALAVSVGKEVTVTGTFVTAGALGLYFESCTFK